MLISIDVLRPESARLNFGLRTLQLPLYQDISIPVRIVPKSQQSINRTIIAAQLVTVLAQSAARIPVKVRGKKLPGSRDYSFRPKGRPLRHLDIYQQVTDSEPAFIQV